MQIRTALNRSLKGVVLDARDEVAVEMARHYARMIDLDDKETRNLGPLLVDVLRELGMTPKARATVMRGGGAPNGGSGSALDEFRARREQRAASKHGSAS